MKIQVVKQRRTASFAALALAGLLIWQAPTEAAAPQSSVSVKDYGAVPNGKTDSLAAFQKAIAAAKTRGGSVYVPPGNYALSGRLFVDGVGITGAGQNLSILTSTDPANGSIDLKGSNVSLKDLTHVYKNTAARDGSDAKNSITVLGASNFSIRNVRVVGAGTAGILVRDEAKDGVISDNVIKNTKADGIHITDGSSRITIENNTVKQTGDDTIAVVSYKKDPVVTSDVVIRGNSVGYASGARGISVVGGSGVKIEKNTINNTEMAGIYIAVEAAWKTRDVNDVNVSGNTIVKTGTRPTNDHPNVLVFADTGSIDEIRFDRNVITDSTNAGIGVWGDGKIGKIYFTFNQVKNPGHDATNFKKGDITSEGNSGF
ncbi:hypothetical protein CDO73_24025 [Saccharibacillus sp. O23]|uniref:glycosyl hydrolase family 28-related protein n=1 Tax=Saccharibacillus sp. O23 TaxID=2009338 RepID=UPI000B4DF92B|nr:right-handed parallel beta-helix repeat-containing protein [Saccharibacillus sp. O23]OWR26889.1 hypothetical protein CDO73_24025 [Saccharibacillus sp. O23]